MKSLVTIGLSPNVQPADVRLALNTLLRPWAYIDGPAEKKLMSAVHASMPDAGGVYLFNSGRSALLTFLRTLRLEPGAEVLLQAFTCNAVSNPILWAGLKPVYVDISDDESYNMSAPDLQKKITPQSKVLIIQHTFGQAAKLEQLLAMAREHNLIVIEDCAHALGATYHGKLVGTFGAAAIFSFGRDKVISSVYGGALVVNEKKYVNAVEQLYQSLPYPSSRWIVQQLIHPPLTKLALRTWHWAGFGRVLFWLVQKLGILSLAVSHGERSGRMPDYFPTRLPNGLAILALQQWQKLELYNTHRREIAALYHAYFKPGQPLAESIYLRYTWRTLQPKRIVERCAAAGIILGDWYWSVIAPPTSELNRLGYHAGSCPIAERVVTECINLPTHINITPQIAQTIIKQLAAISEHELHRTGNSRTN